MSSAADYATMPESGVAESRLMTGEVPCADVQPYLGGEAGAAAGIGAGAGAEGTRKYQVVADFVRARVDDGTLKPGRPAPSGAELSRVLGYSVATCRHGLDVLVADGTLASGVTPLARLRVAAGPGAVPAIDSLDAAAGALSAGLSGARRAAGLTQPDLAGRLSVSVTSVGHAETKRLWHGRGFWEAADAALGTRGTLAALHDVYLHARAAAAGEPAGRAGARLTPRQREAAVLFARGTGIAEIADRMRLAEQTVRLYLVRACARTGTEYARDGARGRMAAWLDREREAAAVPAPAGGGEPRAVPGLDPETRDEPGPTAPALTGAERRAVRLAGELYTLIASEIAGDGATREDDLAELRYHVHAIQNAVKAQAAARLYPLEFRMLGSELPAG
jgi:DNA-binding CsgD family transcriptional regulator